MEHMEVLEQLPLPLLEWFRDNARVLPWRSDPTPYHVWVSEVMLQQTRVAAVLGYYERFMAALPTVADLAACPKDELMKLWQGLGYYSRARNLQKAARQIMEEHGGEFPGEYAAIRGLAGVGDYTAGAIAAIAFGLPEPAVDGNVLRVATRLTGDERDITRPETKRDVTQALRETMPSELAGAYDQALMELGALVCVPNGEPLCQVCPARSLCVARREGSTGRIPVKAAKKARRIEERRVWLIFRGGRVALRRRPEKGLLAGLWEYPNELAPGTCPVAGERVFAARGKHIFTHIEWQMEAWLVQAESDALPEGWIWADRAALERDHAIPSAFQSFAHIVEENVE